MELSIKDAVMNSDFKRQDGFAGELMISIPPKVWAEARKRDPLLHPIYITYIGYFPKASFHYRERRRGCDDNILFYCVQGKGYYIIDGKYFVVQPNQFVFLPATEKYMRYWADPEDPWTIYWVHFTGDHIHDFNQSIGIDLTKGPVNIPFNGKGIDTWRNIYQTLEMGLSADHLCNASFCLYQLIATFLFPQRHLFSEQNNEADIITRAILNMRDNLAQRLTVEQMAGACNLSASHFSSLFRKATGMPPLDYFIHLKMQKACQLLHIPNIKIKSVGLTIGYDDPYYFSRMFKRYLGSSPEQYRENARISGEILRN
ncbi:MAG: AraC family transcriptional regulator [Mucilaginibacter sp.]|uniref:AraC family transcriptional regulator n=1 Tax=Mucilaginibacter sp. TaxID=1882438 RepID=UPI0031A41C3D